MKSRQITIAEMAPHVHGFEINENKVDKIAFWLTNWIKENLKSGKIKPYDMLPSKSELAFHIGVSKGTIQNVFRYVEDCGLIESKQRIGTYIKNPCTGVKKLTSKRELAVEIIKKFLLENNYKEGDFLISIRKMSAETGISAATIRIAINSLISENIIKRVNNAFAVKSLKFSPDKIEKKTLVKKVAEKLKMHIKTLSEGERLPSNTELAQKFNVSIKTIHDAVKILSREGFLCTRRGRYGTVIAKKEDAIPLYSYEKIEFKIRKYIAEKCDIGIKLPSIIELSKYFNVSGKTIKKALDNLAGDGYLAFSRGRYGGTFVTDIPQEVNESYKWLALSSDYVENN